MSRVLILAVVFLKFGIHASHCGQSNDMSNGKLMKTGIEDSRMRNLLRKTDRVKGGIDAPEGRFPYVCNIRKIGSDLVVCGAVLVSEHWVLTAAHCVEPGNSDAANINPIVHCGVNELEHENDDLIFVTEEIRIHEDWDGETENGNDIALLKLERPCNLTTPIIPRGNITFQIGQQFAVLGWGKTSSAGPYASTLQLADDLPYVPKKNCNSELLWDGSITDAMLCAGSGSTDSCQGDSGGPLILANRKAGNDILEGRPKLDLLVGIVSFGQEPCGETGLPGVYTSVSYYIEWIDSVINEEEDEEDKEEALDSSTSNSAFKKESIDTTEKGKHETPTEDEEVIEEEDETTRLIEAAKRKHRRNTKSENLKVTKRAITKDYAITLQALLELGLDVDTLVDRETKTTLLQWAAEHSALDCLQVLIEAGAKLTKKDKDGGTALGAACLAGSVSATKLLVKVGISLKEKNNNNETLLHLAGTTNTPSLVHYLLRKKLDLEAKDVHGQTPLFEAAGLGSPSVMKAFLRYDPELDVHDIYGLTPLHLAVSSRQIYRDIFINGPDFPNADEEGFIDPYTRLNTDSGQVVKVSATYAITPERKHERWVKNKPKNRDIDVIKLLLDAGAPVSALDNQRKTPLHLSVASNSTEIIETLVKNGANVNARDTIWNTPLHEAAFWSTPNVVQALVEANADLEAKDIYGNTPLHIAVSYGNYNTSEALLENGADPFATNRRGLSISNATCTITTCANEDELGIRTMLLTHGIQRAIGTAG